MSALILAQDVAEASSLQRTIAMLSILLSVGALLFALSKSRVRVPLRPAFDVARLAVQVVGVLAMARFSGVSTSVGLLVGAAVLGAAFGSMQGQSLEVTVEEGRVWLRRSVLGVLIWGGGLVVMQAAGLANRAGAVRLGQAVAWFSIGVTVGLLFGRNQQVQVARRAAGVGTLTVLLSLVAVGALIQGESPAGAQTDEEVFLEEFMRGCDSSSRTPSFDSCAEAWPTYWAGLNGQFDFCYDTQFAGAQCQLYFDSILMSGQTDLSMLTCEGVYSQVPSCLGENPTPEEPDEPPDDPPTGSDTPASGEDPPERAPDRTVTVTEDINPNAVPDVVPIPDEGELLERPLEPAPQSGQEGNEAEGNTGSASGGDGASASAGSGSSSGGDNDDGGSGAGSGSGSDTGSSSNVDGSSDGSSGGSGSETGGSDEIAVAPISPVLPDDEDTVTGDEAVAQAVAGLLAAAVIGLITWAEAFQTIDLLRQQGSGTAAAQYGHLQQQYPDFQADPVGVGGGGPSAAGQTASTGNQSPPPGGGSASIPSSQWIPGGGSGGGGAPSATAGHGPGSDPNWFSPSGPTQAGPANTGMHGGTQTPSSGGPSPTGWGPTGPPSWAGSTPSPTDFVTPEGANPPGAGATPPQGGLDHGPFDDGAASPTDFVSPDSSSSPVGDDAHTGETEGELADDSGPDDVEGGQEAQVGDPSETREPTSLGDLLGEEDVVPDDPGDDPYVPESMPDGEAEETVAGNGTSPDDDDSQNTDAPDAAQADRYSDNDVTDLLGGAELPTSMEPVEQGGGMGVPRSRAHDLDHDGQVDHVEYDLDGDGEFETRGRVVEDDAGNSSVVDSDGNPLFEPVPDSAAAAPHEMRDADGTSGRFLDTDGDGVYDRWEVDEAEDGTPGRAGRMERRDDEIFLVPDGEELPPVPEKDPFSDMLVDLAEDSGETNQAEPREFDIAGHRTRLSDTDGDGEYDLVEGDTDGDGEFDVSHRAGTPSVDDTSAAAPETTQSTAPSDQGENLAAPVIKPEDVVLPDGGNMESFHSDMADLYAGENPADRQWRGSDFIEFRDEDHDGRADLIRSDVDGDGDVDGSGRVSYDDEGRAEFDIGVDSDDDGIPDSRVRRFHDSQGRAVTERYDENGVLQQRTIEPVDGGSITDPPTGDAGDGQ